MHTGEVTHKATLHRKDGDEGVVKDVLLPLTEEAVEQWNTRVPYYWTQEICRSIFPTLTDMGYTEGEVKVVLGDLREYKGSAWSTDVPVVRHRSPKAKGDSSETNKEGENKD